MFIPHQGNNFWSRASQQAIYRLLTYSSSAHVCTIHSSAIQPHEGQFGFGAFYLPFPFCHAVYQDKLRKVVMKTNTVATVPFRSLISFQHYTCLCSISDEDLSVGLAAVKSAEVHQQQLANSDTRRSSHISEVS